MATPIVVAGAGYIHHGTLHDLKWLTMNLLTFNVLGYVVDQYLPIFYRSWQSQPWTIERMTIHSSTSTLAIHSEIGVDVSSLSLITTYH